MIWLSSDHHFGHTNICQYTGRPFESTDHMNKALINNHNEMVDPNDTVILVGDMCMGKIDETLPLIGELNGYKILVLGNHDRPFPTHKRSDEWFKKYSKYVDEMYLHMPFDKNMLVSHFPYEGDSHDKDRYQQFRPERSDEIDWLIHGHVHSPAISIGSNMIHVGIDADWQAYGVERYHPIPSTAIYQFIEESS